VEGYEFHALKGMKHTLETFLPNISIEITVSHQKRIEMIDLLKSLGYDSFKKIESGFPEYNPVEDNLEVGDYFYLHASSSLYS